MDKKTVFIKTPKGESEMSGMYGDMKRVMLLIDDKSTLDEVTKRAPPSLRSELKDILQQMLDAELIRDKDQPVATPKIVAPAKIAMPKMVVPKAAPAVSEELDFTSMAAPAQSAASEEAKRKLQLEAEAKARHDAEAARARNELEAAVAEAKLKASAEAKAKAEAMARLEAEHAARAKAEADAEANARAKQEAIERKHAEAKAKAKQEIEARMRAEQEAARIKAEQEAAKARAELEAARARAEAEAKALAEELARQEAEAARLKAEHEAALVRAELEAAARAKAEAEERVRQEEARIRAEQEAARIKAEQEAARAKAELEAARVRAEEEAKALAAERARLEAEARDKAEQEARARQAAEAARLNAELEEAARQAAVARVEAEEKAKREALLAEQLVAADKKTVESGLSSFQINLDALGMGAAQTLAQSGELQPDLAGQADEAAKEEARLQAKQEAERLAAAEEQKAKQSAAAEMARMKAEMEAAKLRAEQEAREKAEEQALAEEQASAWAEAEQRAQLQAKLDAEQAAQQSAISQAKAEQKPVARARRKPLPVGKIFAGLFVLLLVAVVVLPYVWPMQKYVASIEQILSAQMKQPVHIGGMSAALFPPKLHLQNVSAGNMQEIKVGTVDINFDPTTIFSENKAISDVGLQGVVLDGRHLEQAAGWLKGLGGNAQYTVQHLTISSLQVNTDEIAFPSLKGSAEFAQGAFTRVVLHSENEKMNVELLPAKNLWQISFNIKEMALPILPGVQFGDFSAKGDIGDGDVNFTEINAHGYGGAWSGNGVFGWRKGWHAQGHIQAKEMDLEKIYPKIGTCSQVQVEGTFLLQGIKLSQMSDAPHFDGSFYAKDGVINSIGFAETARQLSREHLPGERTRFDEFTGAVQLENRNLHLTQIKIKSDEMNASGSLDIPASSQLAGNFSVEIKDEAGKIPLVLSGSLIEPKLRAR